MNTEMVIEKKTWRKRLNAYSYSLDDKSQSYRFSKEIEKEIMRFLDDITKTTLCVGSFNIEKEPWRILALNDYRKFGVKILEKPTANNTTELHLIKKVLAFN